MKSLITFAAVVLCLTPAFAQSSQDSQQEPSAPPPVASTSSVQPPSAQQPSEQQPAEEQVSPDQIPRDQQQSPDVAPPSAAGQHSIQGPVRRRPLEVTPAVRPLYSASAYPVSRDLKQFSLGARLLSEKQVEQKFSTPLGKHYLVVEIAVFPTQEINLRPDSFTLRGGKDDQAFFPEDPRDVARGLSRSANGRGSNVRVFPSVGVGYENGPWGRGVSTSTGVGVGVGDPYPGRRRMGDPNTRVMENELTDKSFLGGTLTQPAAGYLYFPLSEKRGARYTLEFVRNGETVSLVLPQPKK